MRQSLLRLADFGDVAADDAEGDVVALHVDRGVGEGVGSGVTDTVDGVVGGAGGAGGGGGGVTTENVTCGSGLGPVLPSALRYCATANWSASSRWPITTANNWSP